MALDLAEGSLVLTEAGAKKRASLHVAEGEAGLTRHDPGGIEPLHCDAGTFAEALRRENHTLKRALTDPRLIAGIGNAYSDEILHAAQLSPLAMTGKLTDDELTRLHASTQATLGQWCERLRREAEAAFPEKVTPFRDGMAVHGRFQKPCPACGTAVQRIRYATNEANYCPRCQTGGRLLADRALSRLLRADWPRRIEELEGGPGHGGRAAPAAPGSARLVTAGRRC
jgi:formamidopyrimidine-DNA glycosylase